MQSSDWNFVILTHDMLQAHMRCYSAYSYYKSLQKAAIITQCGWRRRVARRELRQLKMVCYLSMSQLYYT